MDGHIIAPQIVLPERMNVQPPRVKLSFAEVDTLFAQKREMADRWARDFASGVAHDARSETINYRWASLLWELDQVVDDMLQSDEVVWSAVEQFRSDIQNKRQFLDAKLLLDEEPGLAEAFVEHAKAYAEASYALRSRIDDRRVFSHLRAWSGGLVFSCYLCSKSGNYFDVALVATLLHDLYDYRKDAEKGFPVLHDYFDGEKSCVEYVSDHWFRIAKEADESLRVWMDRWVAWQSSPRIQQTRGYDKEKYERLDRIFRKRRMHD